MEKQHKIIGIGLVSMIFLAIFFLVLYHIYNYSFYAHLAAVFVELTLSLSIIELVLSYLKRQETFKVYSLAKNSIFERVFFSFNKALFDVEKRIRYIDRLGNKPSFSKDYKKQRFLAKMTEEILNEMSDKEIMSLPSIIKRDYHKIESFTNSSIVIQNKNLLESMVKLLDICYKFNNIKTSTKKKEEILYSFKNNKKIKNYKYSWRAVYREVIYRWLYIINNFIFFSKRKSKDIRNEFKELKPPSLSPEERKY